MASQKVLYLREDAARKRLSAALDAARKNGAPIREPVFDHRFQDVARVEELEFFAEAIEVLSQIDVSSIEKERDELKAERDKMAAKLKAADAKAADAKAKTAKAK